ncbi:flagellar motor stator protein MotA [Legionella clemsonensis]|uniref:Motility protein A n=1 Tax=Legionella clemsonensis TaxID=1867846 RepID=A0A222P464_9GAMM|nr:flagellar motor stator protein MotA [Legionella clemsonensis]ASQ46641.1 Motility protein A [Legionella clemsonensis]
MLILIGYFIILLSVFGGFALAGGHLAAIMQPVELLIIAGAALGSLVVGNNLSVLKSISSALPVLFTNAKSSKTLYKDLLSLLYALMNKGRQEGFMSLENDVDDPASSAIFTNYPRLMAKPHIIEFLCDYLRLMITSNMQPYQLESLMESEIETYHQEDSIPANAIAKLADGMPAFGIVAAVLGVVHSMESINLPPSELGVLVAQALVGTFLGILLGYGFIGPLATAMEQRTNDAILMLNCIKVTLLASAHNYPPIIATEFGRKVLFSTTRPSFNELNEEIKPSKQETSEEAA